MSQLFIRSSKNYIYKPYYITHLQVSQIFFIESRDWWDQMKQHIISQSSHPIALVTDYPPTPSYDIIQSSERNWGVKRCGRLSISSTFALPLSHYTTLPFFFLCFTLIYSNLIYSDISGPSYPLTTLKSVPTISAAEYP